ncbi:MAG: ATP-binding protein [Bacteroidaceae bacterium]|nr:ATP-binding protein [Bacteroidaceae bacterium]MBR1755069.1 ATP-binding protein [Bacteroidaceae bacterium]
MQNPFVTNGYAGPEYFCDRERETALLTDFLTNENNVALISPRRIGKTELLHHCFQQPLIKEHYHTFIIDIYATTSVRDFVNVCGKAIIDELRPKGRSVWERFLHVLQSLRSEISFDINGMPVWGLGLGTIQNPIVTLDEIFCYLNDADKPCIVAIDEFQQISRYGDAPNMEASLRTYIQRTTNAHFVFSGSQRHLMGAMFTSPSRPFYQSVTIMNLPLIPLEKYLLFAQGHFAEHGKSLDDQVVKVLYKRFDGITSYLQRIMNLLFLQTGKGDVCRADMIDPAINTLLDISNDTYLALVYQMPEKQRNVLWAIAREGVATGITGAKFLRKHHLPSASSVRSAINGLLEKDFITNDAGVYCVYDKFLELWIARQLN